MKTLKETSRRWGNQYRRYYFLDRKRIPEAEAKRILNEHDHELILQDSAPGQGVFVWNIGPRTDAPDLMDHPDMA